MSISSDRTGTDYPLEVTIREGGTWYPARLERSVAELLYFLHGTRYYYTSAGSVIWRAKLPSGRTIHSVKLPDGRVWDSSFGTFRYLWWGAVRPHPEPQGAAPFEHTLPGNLYVN